MNSDRRGFFKKLLGLSALALGAKAIDQSGAKLPPPEERTGGALGFNCYGNAVLVPYTFVDSAFTDSGNVSTATMTVGCSCHGYSNDDIVYVSGGSVGNTYIYRAKVQ